MTAPPGHSSNLTRYYAESGTPPGVFFGAGLAALDDGRGVETGSPVTEQHLFNLLGMCADPVTGKPLGRQPNRSHLSLAKRVAERVAAIPATDTDAERAEETARIEAEERAKGGTFRTPGGRVRPHLLAHPSRCPWPGRWPIGTPRRRSTPAIAGPSRSCSTYAEREVFHSRSGTNGVVQEDVEGVVAAAFTHWDSRAGDPQLHDHVVVANRARSVSDGTWRTLDSRGLFKSVVALSELHQGVLSDLLTEALGWGWDGRARRHSDQLRFEVTGVPEALMAEFSQRSAAIEERKTALDRRVRRRPRPPADQRRGPRPAPPGHARDPAGQGTPQPGRDDRRLAPSGPRATSETTSSPGSPDWPTATTCRCCTPATWPTRSWPTRPAWRCRRVAERRATFSRANVLAEVHRQLHGVRFASPDDRIAVAERTADLATGPVAA